MPLFALEMGVYKALLHGRPKCFLYLSKCLFNLRNPFFLYPKKMKKYLHFPHISYLYTIAFAAIPNRYFRPQRASE